MSEQNLKTDTPDATFAWASAFLFGADSQAAAAPSIYAASTALTALLALANAWTAAQTVTATVSATDLLTLNGASTSTNIFSDFAQLNLHNGNTTVGNYTSILFSSLNASSAKVYGAGIQAIDKVKTAGATTTELSMRVRTAGTPAEVLRVVGAGLWVIGNNSIVIGASQTPAAVNPGMVLQRAITGAANAHGYSDYTAINLGAAQAYATFDCRVTLNGSNAVDHFNGVQFAPTYNNSVTCDSMRGFSSFPIINSGTITALRHLSASPFTGVGTVTTQYGLWVDDLTNGGTNWGIWVDGATKSRFGGTVVFDAPTTAKAQINLINGVAPTSPADGDIWFDGANLKMRVSGATKTFTLI